MQLIPGPGKSILSQSGLMSVAGTFYSHLFGGAGQGTDELYYLQICPFSGLVRNLYLRLRAGYPGATLRATVRVAQVDTPLTVLLTAGQGPQSNFVNQVRVVRGDFLTLKLVATGDWTTYPDWGNYFTAAELATFG